MTIEHAIVVDKKGFKVEYVLVDTEQNIPLYYILKDGESLIYEDVATALRMIRPQWNGKKWVEKATEKEKKKSRYISLAK